jgi:eukaryotic-like serine/threonine-protein kinase
MDLKKWMIGTLIACSWVTSASAAQAKRVQPAALVDLTAPAVAISPDGKQIALVLRAGDKPQLHLRSLQDRDAKPVAGTEGAGTPFFSPDGKWIAFFADGKLKKLAVDSRQIVTLCDATATARGAA